ncbi:glycine/betaine ABC transporter substrate-binding protein [Methanogenium marinum]|uniref:Glycine/betaine ABC transporter substrate-binding protein n=1 Tax=Methanogenium marinum TaxID=348610 RepID=A0A9Q4PWR7_9EURY|nr:glycine betaine ABC transporter substrate-binding protein [Methanogenium marinum]MDE4907676.1 glycine/betaine ABC transporter substrate-binding protein [Methanogenium marinum]
MKKIALGGSILMAAILIFLCVAAGCSETAGSTDIAGPEDTSTIVIGGKPFNEQYILAEMLGLLLEEQGYKTEIKSGMNDITLYEGIKKDQIDVYVEYTGTAYSQLLKLPPLETWDPNVVYTDVVSGLSEDGITVLCRLGFRDDYTIAVRQDWADENSVRTIEDLVPYAGDMVFGSDLVFHEREDGLPRIEEVYGIAFKDVKSMSPTLVYEAIANEQVDAIPPYTTDSRVDLYDLQTLEDPKAALPPYETMIVMRDEIAEIEKITATLLVLEDRIDTETMRSLNAEFDIDKRDARAIARDYLVSEGLISG